MLNDAGDSKARDFFPALCRLGRRHKESSTSTPGSQGLEIELERPLLAFYRIIRRRRKNNKTWHSTTDNLLALPAHFDLLLADYSLALTPTNASNAHNIVSSRPRIDTILHLLLAHAKRRLLDSSAAEIPRRRGSISICAIDYALWYGDPRYFETNFVVIRARKMIVDGGSRQFLPILAAMSFVQRNRVKRKVNQEVYGIFTDGVTWMFLHLDKWNRTDGQQHTITNLISKILDDAIKLRLLSKSPKISLGSTENRLSPWDVRRWDYVKDEVDEDEGFTPDSFLPYNTLRTCWLYALGEVANAISPTNKGPGETQDLAELFSRKNSSYTDVERISCSDVHDKFGLEYEKDDDAIWRVDASQESKIPDHLKRVLEDYELAFGGARRHETLLRVKVEAMLFILLAFVKKKDYSTNGVGPSGSLHWRLDVPFTYKPVLNKRTKNVISPRGELGHALFYGSPEKVDTNLIVVITKCPNTSWGEYQAKAHMGKLPNLDQTKVHAP
ncbi:hypothetical protein BJX62DRAFT_242727 [Aspergillus germanicus]